MSFRYLSGVLGWSAIAFIRLLFVPTLPSVWYLNTYKIPSEVDGLTYDGVRVRWQATLVGADDSTLQQVETIYQQAMNQITGIESKAAGLLSVCSIVAAGALVAFTGDRLASTLGLLGLFYVTCAATACAWLLVPKARHVALLEDVLGPSHGYAEMAAATRSMEPVAIRASNLVTSSAYDLRRALIMTLVGLIAFASPLSPHQRAGTPTPSPSSMGSATTVFRASLPADSRHAVAGLEAAHRPGSNGPQEDDLTVGRTSSHYLPCPR